MPAIHGCQRSPSVPTRYGVPVAGADWRPWGMDPPSRALYRRVEVLIADHRPQPEARGEVRTLLDLLHGHEDMTRAWWRPVGPFA